ncbi:AEC family transporter [Salinigranum halophilum]|jgi:predicted permease|uniref:AEC family transporter n=1 Tax=Salinigranum halophilum TaxID=2565931 RepID=UPI0010A937EF|nr:AEC family transporter [Salinigranum halophilum]
MSLLSIFATAILPIFAISVVGFVLGRVRDVDPGPLNTVTVYVLAPALVFHSLATTELGAGTLVDVALAVVAYHVVMILVAEGVGRVLGGATTGVSAIVLVSAFPNSGNFGVPVSEFAFGETGRATAVLYLTVQAVLMYTVGVYIASRGNSEGALAGVRRVFTVPLVYAVVAALAARALNLVPPTGTTAMATLKLVGDSAIPVMLLILGLQLAETNYGATLRQVGTATVLKMGVAPVVAAGVALAIGFTDPVVGRVFVLESAMPAAITPLILLVEFGEGEVGGVPVESFVSTAVLVTTLVSVPVLTGLIALLDAGLLF